MKNKLPLLTAICYTITALGNLALAIEGDIWPLRLLCTFAFGYLAVKMYRKHLGISQA